MSATPGHSQHQLGTAVDFTNRAAGYQLGCPSRGRALTGGSRIMAGSTDSFWPIQEAKRISAATIGSPSITATWEFKTRKGSKIVARACKSSWRTRGLHLTADILEVDLGKLIRP